MLWGIEASTLSLLSGEMTIFQAHPSRWKCDYQVSEHDISYIYCLSNISIFLGFNIKNSKVKQKLKWRRIYWQIYTSKCLCLSGNSVKSCSNNISASMCRRIVFIHILKKMQHFLDMKFRLPSLDNSWLSYILNFLNIMNDMCMMFLLWIYVMCNKKKSFLIQYCAVYVSKPNKVTKQPLRCSSLVAGKWMWYFGDMWT